MRLRALVPAIIMLAMVAVAGNQLPSSGQWNGTDSQGDHRTEVKSSSTGNKIIFTRLKQTSEGVVWKITMECVWDSSDNKYHTPQGGTVEFDDVVNGNTTAYNYTYTDASGGTVETGLVSSNLP